MHTTGNDLKGIKLSEKKKPMSKGYIQYVFIYVLLSNKIIEMVNRLVFVRC